MAMGIPLLFRPSLGFRPTLLLVVTAAGMQLRGEPENMLSKIGVFAAEQLSDRGLPSSLEGFVVPGHAAAAVTGPRFIQQLTNYWDLQYTGSVTVGGQEMRALFDTGSFEQYVLSKVCSACGDRERLYKNEQLSNKTAEVLGIASFGSGTVFTTEVMDSVEMGPIVANKTFIWAVTDAKMDILEENSFEMIFGIGPPATAVTLAEADATSARDEANERVDEGGSITPEMRESIVRYDGSLAHAKKAKPFVRETGVTCVSYCLKKPSGSEGIMVWNDDAVGKYPDRFLEVSVDGTDFWSAPVSGAWLGRVGSWSTGHSRIDITPKERVSLGCLSRTCKAILDTGSSLIAAPSHAVAAIYEVVEHWVSSGGTCDDLSGLPDLELDLGGVKLSLPAESYVGKAFGGLAFDVQPLMPNFGRRRVEKGIGGSCEVLIAEIGDIIPGDSVWILGLPFFRKYFTAFTLRGSQAGTVAFSEADSDCQPWLAPAVSSLKTVHSQVGQRPAVLYVNASMIRPGTTLRQFGVAKQKLWTADEIREQH
eukprot:TRINITY_DN2953_c0_g1_i1.p1 TRINITY_DN2953_c0_g1~~TRINITY_DN2953_c0_g1_i1.p1  ORF type:complete len:572 (-),score=102.62 TRINITY_DN2953_c0_g1_i1:35-1642(-)